MTGGSDGIKTSVNLSDALNSVAARPIVRMPLFLDVTGQPLRLDTNLTRVPGLNK